MPGKPSQKNQNKKTAALPGVIILAGILLMIAAVFYLKNQSTPQPVASALSAEAQLDKHLSEGKPTFVFFHSNNCQSCIDMIAVVDQVYPDFNVKVALVDVNVYDPANENLLRRAGIYSIPTQVFIDNTGEGKVAIGVMAQDQLRLALQGLAGGSQ